MQQYKVKPEYQDAWFGGLPTGEIGDAIVSEKEIKRLAREWGVSLFDLLAQVDIDEGYMAAAVALMDDEIREEIHMSGVCDNDAQFLHEYEVKHLAKYGEEFCV